MYQLIESGSLLSAIIGIGSTLAVCGGVAYFVLNNLPAITNFFNQVQTIAFELSAFVPEWLQPFVIVAMLLSGIGLLVKLL